jgi:hypothetical protein
MLGKRLTAEQIDGLGGPDAGRSLGHPLAVSARNKAIAKRTLEIHLDLHHELHDPNVEEPPYECRVLAEDEIGPAEDEDRRPSGVAARHLALGSLAQAISPTLNKLFVLDAMPLLTGSDVGIRATLVARGPLASGFLWILENISAYTDELPTPYHWKAIRVCARVNCGREFVPRTKRSRFCRGACRTAAHRDRGKVLASV